MPPLKAGFSCLTTGFSCLTALASLLPPSSRIRHWAPQKLHEVRLDQLHSFSLCSGRNCTFQCTAISEVPTKDFIRQQPHVHRSLCPLTLMLYPSRDILGVSLSSDDHRLRWAFAAYIPFSCLSGSTAYSVASTSQHSVHSTVATIQHDKHSTQNIAHAAWHAQHSMQLTRVPQKALITLRALSLSSSSPLIKFSSH